MANALAEVLVAAGDPERARQLLRQDDAARFGQDAIAAAIVARRARDSQLAHQHFERAGEAVHADPRALLEFAQTKMWLAGEARRSGIPESNRRLLTEARTLLERVLQLDASPARHAWAWRELARTLTWLGATPARIGGCIREGHCATAVGGTVSGRVGPIAEDSRNQLDGFLEVLSSAKPHIASPSTIFCPTE